MVPSGHFEVDVGVHPGVFHQVETVDVGELSSRGPPSVDDELFLVGEDHGGVAASGLRGGAALGLDAGPFAGLAVVEVDVVVGGTLVAHTAVTAENKHFLAEEVGCAVRSGFRSADLGLGVLGFHA